MFGECKRGNHISCNDLGGWEIFLGVGRNLLKEIGAVSFCRINFCFRCAGCRRSAVARGTTKTLAATELGTTPQYSHTFTVHCG